MNAISFKNLFVFFFMTVSLLGAPIAHASCHTDKTHYGHHSSNESNDAIGFMITGYTLSALAAMVVGRSAGFGMGMLTFAAGAVGTKMFTHAPSSVKMAVGVSAALLVGIAGTLFALANEIGNPIKL